MSSPPRASRVFLSPSWLISPGADCSFLLGSVLVSYALFALWRLGLMSTAQLTLLWIFAFHGPHFWGTISRTYLDPTEHARRGGTLRRALRWFLVGPVIVGAGLLVKRTTGRDDVILLFFFVAALWAYHHVVKQHFGFMALYRAKAKEFGRAEFLFHKWYIIVSLWIPAAIVLTNSPGWAYGIPGVSSYVQAGGAARLTSWFGAVRDWGPPVFVALQAAFVLSLVWRAAKGRGINLPEILVAAASVSLHWVTVMAALDPPKGDPLGHYALVPLVTIYHNVQYHALIWYYNKAKYQAPGAAERYGWAARLNQNLGVYFACGVVYTALTIGVESYGLPFFQTPGTAPLLVSSAIWGFSFMHYWLDARIWHVREDEDLRRVLGFTAPPRPAPQPAAVAAVAAGESP